MSPAEVKAIRKGLNLTQPAMADLFGVAPSTVSRWERTGVVDTACEHAQRLLVVARDAPEAVRHEVAAAQRARGGLYAQHVLLAGYFAGRER